MYEACPHLSLRTEKTGKTFPCLATAWWQRGFTLIEMALAFVLAGIMLSFLVAVIGPDTEKLRVEQTLQRIGGKEGIGQLEQALILFAIRNNRLPCPANGALTSASPAYGLENNGAAPPTGTVACNLPTQSVIPWRTLGLDERLSLDGWGNRISYFPASSAIPGVSTLVSASQCLVQNTALSSPRLAICDVAATQMTPSMPYGNYIAVYEIASVAGTMNCSKELTQPNTDQPACPFGMTGPPACNVVGGSVDTCQAVTSPLATATLGIYAPGNLQFEGNRAAYVLISHGRSGWYAWTKAGTRILPPTSSYPLKLYNSGNIAPALVTLAGTSGNYGFVQGPNIGSWPPGNNTSYFDDMVNWRTPSFIIQHCGSLACGNY